ncbi:hypothetical protein JCM11491_004677 [Sporobolomyces phaffii]
MARPRLAKYPASSTESQWFFTPRELERSPSIERGMDPREERRNRQKMISFLWQIRVVSRRLRPPQTVINAAATLLQRFYMRVAFQDWDKYTAVGAALFLAYKVEELPVNSKLVTTVLLELLTPGYRPPNPTAELPEPDYSAPKFVKLRKEMLHYEETMLRTECFDMNLRYPHALLGKLVARVWHKGKGPEVVEHSTRVLDCAWCIANDTLSLHIPFRDVSFRAHVLLRPPLAVRSLAAPTCLLYQPQVIAASCFILACTVLRVPLPEKPLSLSEQKTLWALGREEGEEEDDDNRFEEDVYWLEWLSVRSDELRGERGFESTSSLSSSRITPVTFILDTWNLANDPFVRDEARRIRTRALDAVDRLAPWPPVPRKLLSDATTVATRESGAGSSAGHVRNGDVEMRTVGP